MVTNVTFCKVIARDKECHVIRLKINKYQKTCNYILELFVSGRHQNTIYEKTFLPDTIIIRNFS